ncbi:DUF5629 family protein [Pseudomonas sp. NBRC 111119]|uniref:DUF5629 family protein n=1 Tax=Pseudomonas sp. NBRC 111119 TaxID=1661034 RepID=UPI000760BB4A|nr:DUF5629 family protein [Pseudomonas sp. NBRC 111119]
MSALATALTTCDMILIDGLHAFDFTCDENGLTIECMDGRQLRRWVFTADQVAAASREGNDWCIAAAEREHRLTCLDAFRAPDEDDHEPDLEDTADR